MILFLLLWEVCPFDLFSTFKICLKGQRSQKTSSHFCGGLGGVVGRQPHSSKKNFKAHS